MVNTIKSLKVINTNSFGPPMKAAFPAGHELDTDSNLVLVVGPNGSGKTGFLRAIYSSINFGNYFKANGISQWWHWYGLDTLDNRLFEPDFQGIEGKALLSIRVVYPEDGAKSISALKDGRVDAYLGSLFSGVGRTLGPNYSVGALEGGKWQITDREETYEIESTGAALVIRRILGDWVKCTYNEAPIVSQKLESLKRKLDGRGMPHIHHDILEMLATDPRFNLNLENDYRAFSGDEFITKAAFDKIKGAKKLLSEATDENVWGYMKPYIEGVDAYPWLLRPAPMIRRDAEAEGDAVYGDFLLGQFQSMSEPESTGTNQMRHMKKGLAYIQDFFEKHEMGRLPTRDIFKLHWENDPVKVPDNAQLIALIDEPTIGMDYRNMYKTRDEILRTLEKYPRLQMFIATNDPILIEKTPGCKYVNLYEKPAGLSPPLSVKPSGAVQNA